MSSQSKLSRPLIVLVILLSLGLVLSITINLVQYQNWKSHLADSIAYAGSFRSGDLLESINHHLASSKESPNGSLRVVTDFAVYGVFSHPIKFQTYLDSIKQHATRRKVIYTVLSSSERLKVIAGQYSNYEEARSREDTFDRFHRYLTSEYGTKARERLGFADKDPIDLSFDEYAATTLKIDDLVLEELAAEPYSVEIRYYPHPLSVHAWSGDPNEVVISVVDFRGYLDELGFLARGSAATGFLKYFDIIQDGSDELDE